jgi:1,4-alpha-glucan branching enzyme
LVAFDGESLFEASTCGETCRFDCSRREVLDFLLSGITFWAEKYHVDGFCFCDMDGQDDEAAELIRALVEEKHPDLLLLSDRPRDGYLFINGAKSETVAAEDGEWQRLASVRAAYGYRLIDGMHLHTMGNELGQTDGVLRASLDWRCAEGEATARLQLFFAEANHFYLTHSALWKKGSPWHTAEKNVLVGYCEAAGESPLVIVVNLTPNIYHGYSVTVPETGEYREVFSSDLAVFGGGGVENRGLLSTENRDELKITVPPLAFCVFQKQAR